MRFRLDSYRLHIEKAGYADALYPFLVKRGKSVSVDIALAARGEIPEDFVYVPAGRFLYGDQDEDLRLSFLNAVPIHERELGAFLIKQTRDHVRGMDRVPIQLAA